MYTLYSTLTNYYNQLIITIVHFFYDLSILAMPDWLSRGATAGPSRLRGAAAWLSAGPGGDRGGGDLKGR